MTVLQAAAQIAATVLTAGGAAAEIDAAQAAGKSMTAEDAVSAAAKDVGKLDFDNATKGLTGNNQVTSQQINEVIQTLTKQKMIGKSNLDKVNIAISKSGQTATLLNTIAGVATSSNLTQDQKNFQIAQTVLQGASILDPTGIVGIIQAYTKPLCSLASQTADKDFNFDLDAADRQQVRMELMGNH